MIVNRWHGSAAEFHARPIALLKSAEAWVLSVRRPALVLGSAQRGGVADEAAAAARGVEVVRRSSGGGAVLLEPGRCIWIDILLPRHDPRWIDDVGKSAYWLGDVWADALATLGVDAAVHHGRLEQTEWGRLVCFAAIGPGEVIVAGRKLVGISQRRTRHGARFQCLVHEAWDPAPLLDLLILSDEDRTRAAADLLDVATGPGVPLESLEAALLGGSLLRPHT
jgi:lipoate---protein ligase